MSFTIPVNVAVENGIRIRLELTEEIVNATTGAWEDATPTSVAPEVFISADPELSSATEIGTLTLVLTDVPGTKFWFGAFSGADLSSELLPTYKDVEVYLHVKESSEFHVRAVTTIVDERTT